MCHTLGTHLRYCMVATYLWWDVTTTWAISLFTANYLYILSVGTCNEDQHRLYKCVRSQDKDINIKHVSDQRGVDIVKKWQVTLWSYWLSRGSSKWHPAAYKYTATSKQPSGMKNHQWTIVKNCWTRDITALWCEVQRPPNRNCYSFLPLYALVL